MIDSKRIFWNPDEGFCGDFIPLYLNGVYHLFYIHGSPWEHISTTDFVRFNEHPRALDGGGPQAPDRDIYTGSLIEKDGIIHIFYTGNNGEYPARNLPQQVTMHATSTDGVHFTKDPDFRIAPDTARYRLETWRDPHVFWNADEGRYWMVLTAATLSPVWRHWGCTMLLTSPDLAEWTLDTPIYAPNMHDTHECPDLFQMGDWWYLIYSTYTKLWETRYRMAKNPRGPWLTPQQDVIAGRGYYAAKTVSDGSKRFLVGWACRKNDACDKNHYEWGGSLCVLSISQKPDGTLATDLPDTVRAAFSAPIPVALRPAVGGFQVENGLRIEQAAAYSFCDAAETEDNFLLTFTAENRAPSTVFENSFGVQFYTSEDYQQWVRLRFDCNRGLVPVERSFRWMFDGYEYDECIPADLSGTFTVSLAVYGTQCVLNVNGEDSLPFRCYEHRAGRLGFYAADGAAAVISDIALKACL